MTATAARPVSPAPMPDGVAVTAPVSDVQAAVLGAGVLDVVAGLERRFGARRKTLLEARATRQARLDAGEETLDFPAETADIRAADWTVAPVPADLRDRRVEITGPVDRKMIINALNSGAKAFMADFEDSSTPLWSTMIDGQVNLSEAVRRTLTHTDPATGKHYKLGDSPAVLIVRPRGWHMEETHVLVDGAPVSASLFDFAVFLANNAHEQIARGTGPYFYLPKMESRHEAALWREVFQAAEEVVGLPKGTIRATVLIETLPAAFEMDEILYELRDYIAGLNCGRWDYIFSMIKTLGGRADYIVPDRAKVTMTVPALRAYSQLLIKTCHRRGAHAMGGMAAQIPVKADAAANEAAFAKVRADKEREVTDGHDGTWVAHPGLVPVAMEIFDRVMPGANQVERAREDVSVSAADLTRCPEGTITEEGLRGNIRVGIQYLERWLAGTGCVPLYNLMEDAATAEICRIQVWQWLRHGVVIGPLGPLTEDTIRALVDAEMAALGGESGGGESGRFDAARDLFLELCVAERPAPFLTLPAQARLPDQPSNA